MKLRIRVSSLIFITLLPAITPELQGADIAHLPKPVQRILSDNKISDQSFSLYVKEIGAEEPWITFNSDVLRNPASTIKIVTTLAGLKILGSNYTWKTNFYLNGEFSDGVLNGDLVIQGGGDPFLIKEDFWHILFTLKSRGLQHIKGDLLIDDSIFEMESGYPGDFDQRPYRAYNVFPSAALLNLNTHQFNFFVRQKKLHIYSDPPSATLNIHNGIKLTKNRCIDSNVRIKYSLENQGDVILALFSGEYPATCGLHELLVGLPRNDQYVYGVFKSLWQDMGGTIAGTVGKIKMSGDKPFLSIGSKPLSQIITYINKYSNNVMARQLFLTIGKEHQHGHGGDIKGSKILAREAVLQWLNSIRIPTQGLVLDNGSGLSRITRVSAVTLGKLLEYVYHGPHQPEFMASLPIFGVDGTGRKRLKGVIPAGEIRIKTGMLKNVTAMAGYVYSVSGKRYIVVILQDTSGQAWNSRRAQDRILQWLHQQ